MALVKAPKPIEMRVTEKQDRQEVELRPVFPHLFKEKVFNVWT